MGIVVVPSFGADPVSVTGPGLDAKVDGLATEFNGNIENVNIKAAAGITYSKLTLTGGILNADVNASAAIVASKLDLSSVAQNLVMTSKIFKAAKGADVASLAGAITLGDDGNYFDITGTNAITSITAKAAGTVVILQFDSTASMVDGSNLKLNGNFTGAAESQIMLSSDGTNWFEVSRSPSASSGISTNSLYFTEGYATGRNILRATYLSIVAGGTPGTNVNITATDAFNNPTITNATNLAKNASSGSFALSTNGLTITMDITPAIVGILGCDVRIHVVKNATTTAGEMFTVEATISSANMILKTYKDGSASAVDWITVLTTAGDNVSIIVSYMTST